MHSAIMQHQPNDALMINLGLSTVRAIKKTGICSLKYITFLFCSFSRRIQKL